MLAWVYLVFDKEKSLSWSAQDRTIATIFLMYIFINFAFSIGNKNILEGMKDLFDNLGFLLVLSLLPVLRNYNRNYWQRWIFYSIGSAGLITGIAAVVAVMITKSPRVEVFTGNALVYAYMAGVSGLMNGWLAVVTRGRRQALFTAAFFSSAVALLLSGSRAPIAFFVVTAAAVGLFWLFASARQSWWRAAFVAYVFLFALTCAYELFSDTIAYSAIAARFSTLLDTILEPGIAGGDPAFVERIEMYKAGLLAFWDHPILAYGRQNVMSVASQQLANEQPFPYTHLHNAYITEAVSSGVLGLLAFIAVLWTPLIAAQNTSAQWRGMAILLVGYTAVYNMTNIGFYHDIKVFYYCAFVVLLNSIPKTRPADVISPVAGTDYATFLTRQALATGAGENGKPIAIRRSLI